MLHSDRTMGLAWYAWLLKWHSTVHLDVCRRKCRLPSSTLEVLPVCYLVRLLVGFQQTLLDCETSWSLESRQHIVLYDRSPTTHCSTIVVRHIEAANQLIHFGSTSHSAETTESGWSPLGHTTMGDTVPNATVAGAYTAIHPTRYRHSRTVSSSSCLV